MPSDLLQKLPSLNHRGDLLADCRRHGNHRSCLPYHFCHLGARAATATAAAAIVADADDYCQYHRARYALLVFFLVEYIWRKRGFMSQFKTLQAASTAASTSEILYFGCSATPFSISRWSIPPMTLCCWIPHLLSYHSASRAWNVCVSDGRLASYKTLQ